MQWKRFHMRNFLLLQTVHRAAKLENLMNHLVAGLDALRKVAMETKRNPSSLMATAASLEMPSLICAKKWTECGPDSALISEISSKRQRGDSTSQEEDQSRKKRSMEFVKNEKLNRGSSGPVNQHQANFQPQPAGSSARSQYVPAASTSSDVPKDSRGPTGRNVFGAPPKNSTWRCLRDRQWQTISKQNMNSRSFSHKYYMPFKIASYNVLSQHAMEDHIDLYEGTPEKHLDWDYRKSNLMSEIDEYSPHILCMQEVVKIHFEDFFMPEFRKRGYDSVYKGRTGDKTDGCAIFFKTSKFKLERTVPVSFFRERVNVLDRDNVGLLVKLRPISRQVKAKTRVVIATTHLLFNPRRGDVKLAQLMLLLAEIEKLSYDPKYQDGTAAQHCPVILCGDFNALPGSPLHHLLVKGRLNTSYLGQRVVSGQQSHYYEGPMLKIPLLPRSLGIADTCQYKQELLKRVTVDGQIPVAQKGPSSTGTQINRVQNSLNFESSSSSTSSCATAQIDAEHFQNVPHASSGAVVDMAGHSVTVNSRSHTTPMESTDHVTTAQCNSHESAVVPQNAEMAQSSTTETVEDIKAKVSNLNFVHGGPEIYHPFKLCSVYEHHLSSRVRLVSSAHKADVSNVDYMLYHSLPTPNHKISPLRLTKRLNMMTLQQQQRHRIFLPNEYVSSDHLILLAEFSLKLK